MFAINLVDDKARRSALLNTVLIGTGFLAACAVLATAISEGMTKGVSIFIEQPQMYVAGILVFLVIAGMYVLNRRGKGALAASIFLAALTLGIAAGDRPEQVVAGRTMTLLILPALIAAFTVRPWAAFVFAGLADTIMASIGIVVLHTMPNLPNLFAIQAFALIAWLGAHTLERALAELRALNATLEERVRERTQQLATANDHLAIANGHLAAANDQLAAANIELKSLDEAKSRFFAFMTHELRTPLNAIIGFARLMLKGLDGPLSDMQRGDLEKIHEGGKHLLSLINDILDLSKLAAGKMELNIEDVDVRAVIDQARDTATPLISAGVELRTEVDPGVSTVPADETRVKQILFNLVSNACKFTEQGSVEIRAQREDGQVKLSVRDTGPGIPADKLETIFDEFRQADKSHSSKGTGLGLSISRRLAELHGGRLWVESQVGQGSTFYLTIPAELKQEED